MGSLTRVSLLTTPPFLNSEREKFESSSTWQLLAWVTNTPKWACSGTRDSFEAASQYYCKCWSEPCCPWSFIIVMSSLQVRPLQLNNITRCGLSVVNRCSVVCRSISHDRKPRKNGWTDRDAVWVMDADGPKEAYIGWGPPGELNRPCAVAMRLLVKCWSR